MNLRWSHAVLRVRDVEAMVRFYCDTFDFRVADRDHLGRGDATADEGGSTGIGPEVAFLSGSESDHHQIAFVGIRGEEEATSLDHTAFRVDSIADVKRMIERIAADDRVADGVPVTHGNAISVYFKDPEGNGIEVFCDTPWHVKQPQGMPWDPSQSDEAVLASIEAAFRDAPEFGPMSDYRAKQAEIFAAAAEAGARSDDDASSEARNG